MDVKQKAQEVLDRLKRADDLVITRLEILESSLLQAFNAGLECAADYVAGEVGTAHASDEIRKLHSCL